MEEVAMGQAYFRIIPPVFHPHTCIYYRRYITFQTDSVFKGTTLKQNSQLNWNSEPGRGYYIPFVNIVTDEGHGRHIEESLLISSVLELNRTVRNVTILTICPMVSMMFRVYVVYFP